MLFQVLAPKIKTINFKNLHVVVSLCIMIIQVYFFPLRFNGTTAAVAIVDCVPYFGDGWQCARDQIEDLMDWDPGCWCQSWETIKQAWFKRQNTRTTMRSIYYKCESIGWWMSRLGQVFGDGIEWVECWCSILLFLPLSLGVSILLAYYVVYLRRWNFSC